MSRVSILNQADGSSSFQEGSTRVLCSVNGPIEAKPRQELPTKASLEIILRPQAGVPTTREKFIEDKLRSCLTPFIQASLYPRQLVQIVFQILETDEPAEFTCLETAACINAAYLALIDAGVGLKRSFGAVACIMKSNSEISVSPIGTLLSSSVSHHVVCFDIKNGKSDALAFSESLGEFTEKDLFAVLDLCASRIEENNKETRALVQQKVQNDYIWEQN